MADGTPVIATVGNGGLTPSVPGAVEEWLAFNASVRRAVERRGRLFLTQRDGLERGGDELPARGRFATLERGGGGLPARGWVRYPRARRRCGARSRAPMGTLERGEDRPVGPRGARMGHMLGFFESFTFLQIGRRPWAFAGPVALTRVCVFRVILVPRLGCP